MTGEGRIAYHENIVQKLPDMPKRKDLCVKWLETTARKEQSACPGGIGRRNRKRRHKDRKSHCRGSKGAAAGPYGMLAAGLVGNRKAAGKILAALPPC